MILKVDILSPSPAFEPFIEYYKYIEGYIDGLHKIVPAINQELYFHLNSGNYIFSSPGLYSLKHPLIHFMGLHEYDQKVFSHISGKKLTKGFAIVFKPNGITKLFKLSHSEIHRYAIDANNLFKVYTEEIWHELSTASHFLEMKTRLETFMGRYLGGDNTTIPYINKILNLIRLKKGMLSIGELCVEFHISPRTLQRKFKDEIGMPPKEYMQIARPSHALTLLQLNQNESLTELSYLSGYYDQSHFIRDIRKMCGFTPGNLGKRGELEKCDNRIYMGVSED